MLLHDYGDNVMRFVVRREQYINESYRVETTVELEADANELAGMNILSVVRGLAQALEIDDTVTEIQP